MPIYLYQHPNTEEIIESFQKMNEEHFFIDDKGVKWNRIFTKPNASTDTKLDPWNPSDFVKKTGKMAGTVGEMQDMAKDMALQRSGGDIMQDPIKQKHMSDWEKKRSKGGKKKILHPDKRPTEIII